MGELNQSPKPTTPIGMDLSTALKSVVSGKTIKRLEWLNNDVYVSLNNGLLSLHKDDGRYYSWVISESDLIARDWVVCDLPINKVD